MPRGPAGSRSPARTSGGTRPWPSQGCRRPDWRRRLRRWPTSSGQGGFNGSSENGRVVLDSTHNPHGVRALVAAWREVFGAERRRRSSRRRRAEGPCRRDRRTPTDRRSFRLHHGRLTPSGNQPRKEHAEVDCRPNRPRRPQPRRPFPTSPAHPHLRLTLPGWRSARHPRSPHRRVQSAAHSEREWRRKGTQTRGRGRFGAPQFAFGGLRFAPALCGSTCLCVTPVRQLVRRSGTRGANWCGARARRAAERLRRSQRRAPKPTLDLRARSATFRRGNFLMSAPLISFLNFFIHSPDSR